MKPSLRVSACLAAVLLLATASSTGWAVLCIGEDGHRALEWAHPGDACGAASPASDHGPARDAGLASGARGCLDLPVTALAVVTNRPGAPPTAPPPVDDAQDARTGSRQDESASPLRAARRADPPPRDAAPARSRLRGVVLLI